MKRNPSGGLVYVIAHGGGDADRSKARGIAARLLAAAGSPRSLESSQVGARELPGALWGFVPFDAVEAPRGDRLTHAVAGSREVVLRGDPVWLEPRSGVPCDAGELLRVWESEGEAAVEQLDNMSLAVLSDAASGELTLATDRMGGISLYTASMDGLHVFSSSYLALSRVVESKAVDGDALGAFFHLGYFPGKRTALRDVSLHPFAAVTTIRGGKIATRPYWSPDVEIDRSRSRDDLLRDGVEAFNGSVREYSAGRSRVLLALTAGLDSRSIAASLLRQGIPFEAYTHGFPGCWEGTRVEKIVRRHGIPHRFVPLVETFTSRLADLALESFRATEGTISCIEKSHLIHVLSSLREGAPEDTALLLGEGAGMLKGTYYRLLQDEERFSRAGVDRYVKWNFAKRLPDIFAPDVAARDSRALVDFVMRSLDETGGGSFYQRLDYLYAVRYRRWAGGVKSIYRQFFPTRVPFVSARLLRHLFPLAPALKKAQLPHYAILSSNFPALQYDLTNKMVPALPFKASTAHRFLPSAWWRTKQLLRGFSRQYLPRELFPLVDYVDYKTWIRGSSGAELVDGLLDAPRMKSAHLYDGGRLEEWLRKEREQGWSSFPLIDKMCTLELYFREIDPS